MATQSAGPLCHQGEPAGSSSGYARSLSQATFLDVLPPACDVLRDHQRQQLEECADAIRSGHRRILVQGPTGVGKTHLIASVALAAQDTDRHTLILATRTRLVRQIHERLDQFGVDHGVIAAELRGMVDRFQRVQVASADTLYRRCLVDKHMPLPFGDVVLFDEAHLAAAESRLRILEQYPDALIVGFTATPARRSGRPLSDIFDVLIPGPTIPDLIYGEFLVKPRIFSVPLATKAELDALPKDTTGDYQTAATTELLSKPKLIGDVRSNWLRIANGKRTLIFAVNKRHGAALVEEFQQAGIAAELLTDQDDEETREAVIGRLESGQTTVVVNCFLMAYGVDIPCIECVVLARPTRSVVMYLQMVGRGLRAAPGKKDCIVIDHGRVVEHLGRPTDDFGWTLDDSHNINRDAAEAQSRKQIDERPRVCPECDYTWTVSEDGSTCANCGWKPTPRAKRIEAEAADLVEIDAEAHPKALSPSSPEVLLFFREALGEYAQTKPDAWGQTPNKGRAASWYATCEKFEIPLDSIPSVCWRLEPKHPTAPTLNWLKYRRIKYARSQSRRAF